jgi:acyl-CoA thioester hydrolase
LQSHEYENTNNMKTNPRRLALESYPYRLEMATRLSDIDQQWHVNNVRIGEYYQETRVSFFRELSEQFGARRTPGSRILVAHHAMDYLAEIRYPGLVISGLGIARIGRSSMELAGGLFQGGHCAGLCKTVIVHATADGPVELPEGYREMLATRMLAEGAVA